MSDEAPASERAPTLFRNYTSFAGAVIVAASLASILLLFLIELTKAADNPYLGIVTYLILPGCLIVGLVIIAAGMLVEWRRRRRSPETAIAAYPKIDFERSASAQDSILPNLCFVHLYFHERLRQLSCLRV
jgi:hypothetical protein